MIRVPLLFSLVFACLACSRPAPKFAEICSLNVMSKQPLLEQVCSSTEAQVAYDAALAAARSICESDKLPPEAEPICAAL